MSADLDRFKTRLNESNAMKIDPMPEFQNDISGIEFELNKWQENLEKWNNAMMRNERNNGREDMANAIREVWSAKLYRNDMNADDLIMSAKIYLQNKGK